MLNIKTTVPRYSHHFSIYELTDEQQDLVRDASFENEYRCYDYSDGDYYFLIDFTRQYVPFEKEDWDEDEEGLDQFAQWNALMDYLDSVVPDAIRRENKLAIHCTH